VQSDVRASGAPPLRARFGFQARKVAAKARSASRRLACSAIVLLRALQPEAALTPSFRLFPLFLALLFPLFAIVPAPADFLPLAQGLAL
jgi:hypothetical protein